MADVIKDENIDTTETVVDEPIVETVVEKTFTQDEMNVIIADRIKREKKNAEIEKEEAKRLAKMSESERKTAEFEIEKANFAEERKLYQREKLELQVVKELSTKSLPTEFSKYLIGEDAETCMTNIKEFETKWQQAMAAAIDIKLRGKTPSNGGQSISVNPYKKESYSLTQQSIMEKNDPTLAAQLRAATK